MSLSFNWDTTVNSHDVELVLMVLHLGQLIGDLNGKLSGWCKHDSLELALAKKIVFSQSFNDYIFGCDICQDVCPWNRFSKPHSEKELMLKEKLKKMSKKDWKELTKETFDIIFKDSAIKRCKFDGLKRNILSVS